MGLALLAPAQPASADAAIVGAITVSDPTQANRLSRSGFSSTCGAAKANPGLAAGATTPHYDEYAFTAPPASCVTVALTLTGPSDAGAGNVFVVAYSPTLNPANPSENYFADVGVSVFPNQPGPNTFSFIVPASGVFTLVVSDVPPPSGSGGGSYTLEVTGAVLTSPMSCTDPSTATIQAQPGVVTTGTEGPDIIYGTSGDDQIAGLGGDDIICGGGGNDKISGGAGKDTILGGPGNDDLSGGAGDDLLNGEAGTNRLSGGDGVDTCSNGAKATCELSREPSGTTSNAARRGKTEETGALMRVACGDVPVPGAG